MPGTDFGVVWYAQRLVEVELVSAVIMGGIVQRGQSGWRFTRNDFLGLFGITQFQKTGFDAMTPAKRRVALAENFSSKWRELVDCLGDVEEREWLTSESDCMRKGLGRTPRYTIFLCDGVDVFHRVTSL